MFYLRIIKRLTFITSYNTCTIAPQTSGIIIDKEKSDTLNMYINDVYESPLAKNLKLSIYRDTVAIVLVLF